MNAKKMTKSQLEEVLKSYQNKVADKSITDRISYTLRLRGYQFFSWFTVTYRFISIVI